MKMRFKVGAKVVYPSQGPCLIGAVVQKEVGGDAINFYQLQLLDGSGGLLFLPVERAQAAGVRLLLSKPELTRVLAHFSQPASAVKDWKQRANENTQRLASGSALDLAEVIKSLTELSVRKDLSFTESSVLDRARKLLIGEVAEVMKVNRSSAEAQLNDALQTRTFAPS